MNRRQYLAGAVALVVFLSFGRWLRDGPQLQTPNIVVLTVESWRAETATPERMPNLFSAAAEASRYINHRAISAWTAPNLSLIHI